MILGVTDFFAPKKLSSTKKLLSPVDSAYTRRGRMLTSMRNAFWVRRPRRGVKMVAALDDVCDKPRLYN